jgi:hypothetical protein
VWWEGVFELAGYAVEWLFSDDAEERKRRKERKHMPIVSIEKLPDASRTWVFGSDRTLDSSKSAELLKEVDRFLGQWKAHGAPLTSGRDWKYGRFLTVAVDQSTEGASGCSIDGLFRALKTLEPQLGASLVTSGLVFYSDAKGEVQSVDRERFGSLSAHGRISPDTRVFDPTVTTLGEWKAKFENRAKDSWHAGLLQNQSA